MDVHYYDRLALLAELMVTNGDRLMRDLQRETLKYYPLQGREAIRKWMSKDTAFAAACIANATLIEQWEKTATSSVAATFI